MISLFYTDSDADPSFRTIKDAADHVIEMTHGETVLWRQNGRGGSQLFEIRSNHLTEDGWKASRKRLDSQPTTKVTSPPVWQKIRESLGGVSKEEPFKW